MNMKSLATIILAAGKGTRMKSSMAKVLHKVAGKPMIQHLTDTAERLASRKTIIVVGYQGEQVQEAIQGTNLTFVYQHEQKGTGHAVMQAKEALENFEGATLVLVGDAPLLSLETLQHLCNHHFSTGADATILTTQLENPYGYGRIVRDVEGKFMRIVEQSDLTGEEVEITEINTGIYLFDNKKLFKALDKVEPNNKQGEYYLTDVFGFLIQAEARIELVETDDPEETIGINDRVRLAEAEKILRRRINEHWMREGVTLIDPDTTYIDEDVEIGQDTIIKPFTFIEGKSRIGSRCEIGPQTRIKDTLIGDDVNIANSILLQSTVHDRVTVGPFAYVRPGNEIHDDAKIGDFVEVKNSIVGKGSKLPHLSYVGDAIVGEKCNIGAGTITANYNGKTKSQTRLGDGVFIGSNSTLVAPVTLENGARTGAGAVVTKDVPADTTVVGVPAKKFDKKD